MKRSSTVFGSDTATFLAQISTEAIDGQESLHDETFIVTDTCSEKKPQENSDRKGSVNQKAKSLLDTTASLESTKSGGKKSKYTKADCKPDAVLPKQDLLKAQEPDRSLSDRNLEANVDKASPLNDSTVTISFEEFLQSQNQDDGSSSFDTSDHINEVSNTTSEEFSSQKVSPRTLTIQAEVHPVSPEHEMVNPRMRQLASIFTRRLVQSGKGSNSKSPSHPWEDADIQPTPKRKSNVVLQEEDLVLAVIEAGSTPKCTQTERKQFMNAFKQPTLEAGKAKLRKGPSKQEAANNKTVMLPEEETLTCKKVSKEEKAQLEDVLFRKKGHNKLQRGGKKKAGEESPLLLPASEEKAVSEGGGKAECPDTAGDHTIAPVETTALRRSTRGRAQEMTSEQSTPTQSPMTRSCNRLKNQQKGKEPSQGSLTVTATPKRHLSKHRMYRVEMLSPPDGNSSPISSLFIPKMFCGCFLTISDDEGVSELTGEAEKPTEEKGSAADPPHCQTGCTESLLGLLNIGSDLDPQESSAEPETQKCWKLLTDSWKRGVDLLYTNMEELLPLPVCILETCSRGPQEAPKQSSLQHHVEVCELSDEASPTKVSSRIRRKRCLSHTDQATPVLDSDTDDDFLSLPKVLASTLVSCCLESMAEFLDHMSFLDSSLKNQDLEMEGTCRPGALGWIGAEVKSGLTDEPREAHSAGYGQWEEAAEVRAVTESLSFQRCHKEVSEVWVEAQKLEHEVQDKVIERLSLPVALHRKGFSLFESSLCEPRVIQMRGDVLRTTSSRVLSMLGNKPAAAMDYLPSLRTICRSERLKEQGKVKRRFLHYLDGIHLGLPRNTVQILAEDFP
uniref:Uncharacterized protein n=1 Tax=Scleropages formosus TaxID=113540 RepID=A0A8C9VQZ0_SCLFO